MTEYFTNIMLLLNDYLPPQFRLCWLLQKLREEAAVGAVGRGNDHAIVAVPALACTAANLEACYGGTAATLGYGIDGLLFVRR